MSDMGFAEAVHVCTRAPLDKRKRNHNVIIVLGCVIWRVCCVRALALAHTL